MINKGDTVAVGLSGGADSMALFHLLYANKEKLGINLVALHVNHGLRSESDEEEIFITDYCRKLGAECVVKHFDMNNTPKPQGLSTEMWARQLRYAFFEEETKKRSAKIATAHSLSDKCETVIFNLCRGTSLKGVCGIPAVRGNIIRPLINCTRTDIENYCKENDIPFVTDKTNFSEEYSRNKIRLKVVPVLKQINEKSENLIGEFTQEMEQIYTFLTQLSDTLYRNSISLDGFHLETIKKQDDVVIKFFLRNILDRYGCLSRENISDILEGIKNEGFTKQLSKDIVCQTKNGYLTFYKPKQTMQEKSAETVPVTIGSTVDFMGDKYVIREISTGELEKNKKNDKNYLNNCIDCDTINCKLFLRTRRTGDRFTLANRGVTKTLKKLFTEDKIPLKLRDSLAVLADVENVIWLENYGTNGPYRVKAGTKRILVIENK
ncbi:MAG: tRNA lysidine(34) synthetase TilS [Oscillospiraceae bacterium]|nr:tRNA lysidine(34) synthetase TilS [Oscillospiraceae bacterium]